MKKFVLIFMLICSPAMASPYEVGEGSVTVGFGATVNNSIFMETYAESEIPEDKINQTVVIDGIGYFVGGDDHSAQIIQQSDNCIEVQY